MACYEFHVNHNEENVTKLTGRTWPKSQEERDQTQPLR